MAGAVLADDGQNLKLLGFANGRLKATGKFFN
jgi:hypothetical protein